MSTEGIAISVANEALKKSTGGVIDALLGPKLKRLGKWATERDLKRRISEDRLQAAFSNYLTRLLERVSGLTTLIFPEQVLSLPDAYEPLVLIDRGIPDPPFTTSVSKRSETVSELMMTRRGARTYVIDGAGMGKSTFARHLAMSEVLHRDRIPLLLELRRIADGETLIDALANDLDEFHQQFERDVFLYLLSRGRFLIILDGLDEVADARHSGLLSQIEDLASKTTTGALVLTSRPEVPLPRLTGARLASIQPLEREQAESLVRRYDRVANIDVGERLIAKFRTVPREFLQTPLLLALLYRSFGYNGEVSTRVTAFYEELYFALFKGHDLSKQASPDRRPQSSTCTISAACCERLLFSCW